MLFAIALVTVANIRSTSLANREAENERLLRIEALMQTAKFPITSGILENIKALSGAEFSVTDKNGLVKAKSNEAPPVDFEKPNVDSNEVERSTWISKDGQAFYHSIIRNVPNRERISKEGDLHIFLPKQTNAEIWWQSSRSPVLIALFVLPLALVVSAALASQVTKPLSNLQNQVARIAEGARSSVPTLDRNDEIGDLTNAVNQMAGQLEEKEGEIRKSEGLRAVVQMGSSLAHHLRNSATGCKMAIELLAAKHDQVASSENYEVAMRQLKLMDSFIVKFVSIARSVSQTASHVEDRSPVQLSAILNDVVTMLEPMAQHLGVELNFVSLGDDSTLLVNGDDVRQLMINLLSNAIQASSEDVVKDGNPQVTAVLNADDGKAQFTVTDNGNGPPESIADKLFQPFVTGRQEGTGLGLYLVKEVSERYGGGVTWYRDEGKTVFDVRLGNGSNEDWKRK